MWKIYCFLFVFGAAVNLNNAVTQEDSDIIFNTMKPSVLECAKELGVEDFDIDEFRKHKAKEPCLYQCVLEKMDAFVDGKIVLDALNEKIRDVVHDEDDLQQIILKGQNCADEANESAVSDDDKDCARVDIFHHCLKDKHALLMASS